MGVYIYIYIYIYIYSFIYLFMFISIFKFMFFLYLNININIDRNIDINIHICIFCCHGSGKCCPFQTPRRSAMKYLARLCFILRPLLHLYDMDASESFETQKPKSPKAPIPGTALQSPRWKSERSPKSTLILVGLGV